MGTLGVSPQINTLPGDSDGGAGTGSVPNILTFEEWGEEGVTIRLGDSATQISSANSRNTPKTPPIA